MSDRNGYPVVEGWSSWEHDDRPHFYLSQAGDIILMNDLHNIPQPAWTPGLFALFLAYKANYNRANSSQPLSGFAQYWQQHSSAGTRNNAAQSRPTQGSSAELKRHLPDSPPPVTSASRAGASGTPQPAPTSHISGGLGQSATTTHLPLKQCEWGQCRVQVRGFDALWTHLKNHHHVGGKDVHTNCHWTGCWKKLARTTPSALAEHVRDLHTDGVTCVYTGCNVRRCVSRMREHMKECRHRPGAYGAAPSAPVRKIADAKRRLGNFPSVPHGMVHCQWTGCDVKNFDTWEKLWEHLVKHHLGFSADYPKQCVWLGCESEKKIFKDTTELERHVQNTHAGKAGCKVCGNRVDARYLSKHELTHNRPKP